MGTVHVLLDLKKKIANVGDYTDLEYFEVTIDGKTYRFGKSQVDEETATQYKYYKLKYIILAEENGRCLVDALIPDHLANLVVKADEFKAWSYVDLSAKVEMGILPSYYLRRFLRVRYTVTDTITPDEGEPYQGTLRVNGTLKEYDDDTRPDKTWGQAYIPVKWFGKDSE